MDANLPEYNFQKISGNAGGQIVEDCGKYVNASYYWKAREL